MRTDKRRLHGICLKCQIKHRPAPSTVDQQPWTGGERTFGDTTQEGLLMGAKQTFRGGVCNFRF